MIRLPTILVLMLLALALSPIEGSIAQDGQERIQNIEIEGVQRIEPETVQSYLAVSEGDLMTQENLDKALKSLFGTGLFADVMIERAGLGYIIVRVKENPIVNKIAFEGNEKINY